MPSITSVCCHYYLRLVLEKRQWLLQVAMQTGSRPPAVLCAETTELKSDLGIDPYPKLSCVTDTRFELVDDLWVRFELR
jgi:hypothetical protein